VTTRTVTRPTTPPRARGITAAARRINLTTREGRKLARKPEKWQEEGWAYYDALAPVKFGAGFMGNAMSRIRPFAGYIVDPDEPPVQIFDVAEKSDTTLPAGLAEAADEELARIGSSPDGWPGIMRLAGINLVVAGEFYLIGEPSEDNELADETWSVHSSTALEVKGQQVRLKETPSDRGRELAPDALVYRIWRRHARWAGDADSNLRAALDTAEELVIYGRVLRAIAKSAAHAGIVTIPAELDPPGGQRALPEDDPDAPGPDPDAAGGGDDELTPLERTLVDALVTPIENDDSAAAVAPFMLRGAHQYLDQINWIDIGRKIDDKSLERINQLYQDLAHGLDLPVEVLTGIADLNHWSAWQVSDDVYKAHVEPIAQVVAIGITSAFLRPALLERGFPPDVVRRVVVGLDPSALVTRPNRAADAKDAYERGVIGSDELRAALGFPDDAAPDDEELLRRYVLERGIGGVTLTGLLMRELGLTPDLPVEMLTAGSGGQSSGTGGGTTPANDGGPGENGGDALPPTAPARAVSPAARALLAAIEPPPNPYEDLGERLGAIEAALLARLVVAASDDVADALRRAGSRLRTAVQGDKELRKRVNGLPPEEVGPALGPAAIAALADPDSLLDGAFERLADRWDAWVAQAQADVAAVLASYVAQAPDPAAAERAVEDYRTQAEDDRNAGWVVLAGLLLTFTRERLISAGAEIAEGEYDPTVLVPAGLVRDALARVGGATPGLAPAGSAQQSSAGGFASSTRVRTVLDELGAVMNAFEWRTGFPSQPFEPHQRLSGVVFRNWDDPQLENHGTYPRTTHFWPGDHRGCQCVAVPVVVPSTRSQQPREIA